MFEGTGDKLLIGRNGKEQSPGCIRIFITGHSR
jgi:hypothetical protein